MKNRILAIILCVTFIFSAFSVAFGAYAMDEAPVDQNTAVKDGTENDDMKVDVPENKEKKENFFEAFASMFKEFHPKGFVEQLGVMGIGMLGIFIVIGIIIITTVVVNKAFSRAPKTENK